MSSQETHVESCTDDGTDEASRTVLACPECDSSDIRTNNNGLQGCKAAADHVCRDCGHAFSDVDAVRRTLKRSVTTPPSIARSLENASPDEVGKPLTDGGHEPDYKCRNCDWAGDECDRREHYPVCPDCSRIVDVRQQLVADGGVPETFDDLAGTCEHCGDDVDPERLIEGECPGCHYHEPIADGGQDVVTIEQEYANTLLEAAGTLRDDIASGRQWGVDAEASRENAGELEDAFQALQGELRPPSNDDEKLVADGGTTWTDLTGFKRDLLESTRRLDEDEETTYGLAIKREIERFYGEEIHHGRLYPNLDDLVEVGLIEKSQLDRRTNEYELTNEAEAMLEQRARLLADACGMEQPVADGGDQA